jgi:hypothetical protein
MKNQYFADERDFVKYDLWMELADYLSTQPRLTFVPMLTGPDGTRQGGKTKYPVGNRRKCLYDFLQSCLAERRRAITELRRFFRSHTRRAYRPYKDGKGRDLYPFKIESRQKYFDNIPSGWLIDSVVLIDPDTGLQTKGPYWKRRPERYAEYGDIVKVAGRTRGDSALIVVQFPQRNANRAQGDLDYRAERLRQELASSGIGEWSVFWTAQRKSNNDKVGDLAFFVLAPRPVPSGKIEKQLPIYAERHDMAYSSST